MDASTPLNPHPVAWSVSDWEFESNNDPLRTPYEVYVLPSGRWTGTDEKSVLDKATCDALGENPERFDDASDVPAGHVFDTEDEAWKGLHAIVEERLQQERVRLRILEGTADMMSAAAYAGNHDIRTQVRGQLQEEDRVARGER